MCAGLQSIAQLFWLAGAYTGRHIEERMGRTRRGGSGAYTGRFFETHRSPEAVIPSLLSGQALSAVKDLRCARREILHCAQDDTSHLAGSFPKKPPRVRLCWRMTV